jgi:quercetin dioxygenase-like cupin family protein
MRSLRTVALLAALPLGVITAQAPGVQWGPAPPIFPAGAKFAVLAGDPSKAGEYTVRLEMPNGYTIAPHYHPTDEHVTIIQGTFLVGMGDAVDAGKTRTLHTGDFGTAMANQHHFGIARGRTIVQVNGMGPFQLTYVNPADDPTKKISKK